MVLVIILEQKCVVEQVCVVMTCLLVKRQQFVSFRLYPCSLSHSFCVLTDQRGTHGGSRGSAGNCWNLDL